MTAHSSASLTTSSTSPRRRWPTRSTTVSISPVLTTLITVTLAFTFAYALTRSCIPFKGLFKSIIMIPILVPSLLPGIALVYLFGNQGMIKGLLMGNSIYGPIGIVIAEVFFTLPHAIIIIITSLSIADSRLYEAAVSLRASRLRIFFTVTLPGCRYGLISAAFVVFTLAITDFGAPKVIGGDFNVLATDIYKQVIGQQNFQMGAVVSVVLLIPALLAFVVDRIVQRKQVALLSSRAVALEPSPKRGFDAIMLGYVLLVSFFLIGMLGVCQYAALIKFYPYNLELGLHNYQFDLMDGGGWDAYFNSIKMALYTAVFGTIIVFSGAYLVEKGRGFERGRALFQFLAMMPMAVPGLVLGLAYIFFFNHPDNPFGFHLSHHDYSGGQHCDALLHRQPSDGSHGAETDGSGIRGGGRFFEATVLQDLHAGHGAGLPACHSGYQHLPVRQRHDHGLGGYLSLRSGYRPCVGGCAEYG